LTALAALVVGIGVAWRPTAHYAEKSVAEAAQEREAFNSRSIFLSIPDGLSSSTDAKFTMVRRLGLFSPRSNWLM
jgi:hypothetical protein